MTPLSSADRMSLLEQLLRRSVPWFARQQMPTGEFVCYREDGGSRRPCVCPLLSALALEALDCLDHSSEHFHERLFDLIPAPDRAHSRVLISTLRWRLQLHLAAQQSAGGEWRLYGWDGNSDYDLATTACAFIQHLNRVLQTRHDTTGIAVRLARRSPSGSADALGLLFLHRLLHLAGERTAELPIEVFDAISGAADPLLPAWAIAQSHRQGAIACDANQLRILLAIATRHLDRLDHFSGRLHKAFGITLFNVCGEGDPIQESAVDHAIDELLCDPEPPWRWAHEPILAGIGSAPVTLILTLRSLAQAILMPKMPEMSAC
jgi:hypothetical protein